MSKETHTLEWWALDFPGSEPLVATICRLARFALELLPKPEMIAAVQYWIGDPRANPVKGETLHSVLAELHRLADLVVMLEKEADQ